MIRILTVFVVLGAACSSSSSSSSSSPSSTSGGGSMAPGRPGSMDVGTRAPEIVLRDPANAAWQLGDALSRHARVMLVFYRGDW